MTPSRVDIEVRQRLQWDGHLFHDRGSRFTIHNGALEGTGRLLGIAVAFTWDDAIGLLAGVATPAAGLILRYAVDHLANREGSSRGIRNTGPSSITTYRLTGNAAGLDRLVGDMNLMMARLDASLLRCCRGRRYQWHVDWMKVADFDVRSIDTPDRLEPDRSDDAFRIVARISGERVRTISFHKGTFESARVFADCLSTCLGRHAQAEAMVRRARATTERHDA